MIEEKIWAIKDGYLVHRDGTIYKLNWRNTGTMRKIKQQQKNDGYLCFGCNHKTVIAHRFIAECFLPNPDNLPQVNHKNEVKTDNRVQNLEWVTAKQNINYGSRNKRVSERIKKYYVNEENRKKQSDAHKNHPKLSKKVLQFTKDGKFVKEWVSTMEIERVLGFDHSYISRCCKGKAKSAYDFIWSHTPLD